MDGDPYHVGQDPELVRSSGGWTAPPGSKPGWDWLPRSGGTPDMIGMPRWLRAWYQTPFLDRRAHVYMWRHGFWWVEPPNRDAPDDHGAGVREPLRPVPTSSEG